MHKKQRALLPSSLLPFLAVCSSSRRQETHNREIMYIVGLLRAANIKNINVDHVDEAGLNKALPLRKNRKVYDISYINSRGEIILIEVMRLYKKGDRGTV